MSNFKNKKIKKIFALFFLIGPVFLQGCSTREDVVAHVGRRKITASDFKRRIEELPHYYAGFISSEGGKRQYLSGMIREEVLLAKSRDFDLKSRPAVARRIEEAKRSVLLNEAVRYLMTEEIKISDKQVRDYYERKRSDFESPRQIKISHILLRDEETASQVANLLDRGSSFARLAREHSIDTITAINGGDLGYVSRGELSELAPQIEDAAFSLENIGERSDIVRSPYGYHIIKLTGRREGRRRDFEEAKEEIRENLRKQVFNQLLERYERELNVRVNYDILDEMELNIEYEF